MSERLAKRVMLIGWDAADWQTIDPLMAAGEMPNLSRFLAGGVRANVQSLRPMLSPILWTSIATGKLADKHDILGFTEPDGQGAVRPVTSTSRKAKAVWNILSQHGLRSSVVGWFASHPAEQISGCVVTDRYEHATAELLERQPLDERTIWPATLIEDLSQIRAESKDLPPSMIEPFIPTARTIDTAHDSRLGGFVHTLAECATVHNAATYLAELGDWDFFAAYYDAIDHFGHGFMEYHPPKMDHISDADFETYRHVMAGVYRYHDLMLGRLLELAGDDTTVIILSDHGFHSGSTRPKVTIGADGRKRGGAITDPVLWHRPYGVFAARGPNIKQGEQIYGLTLLDVAPTILMLLGLPVPQDMDGKPIEHMLDRPVTIERIASYEPEAPGDGVHRGEVREDPFVAQEMLKQLADLGYIEPLGDDAEKRVRDTINDRKSNLAHVHFVAGRLPEAEALLRELLSADDSPHLRARLAMCLISEERHAEARAVLEPAAGHPETAPIAQMLHAQMLFATGDREGSERELARLIQAHPDNPTYHQQLGAISLRRKRFADAVGSFRRTIELDPDSPEAHDGLGVALRETGQCEDAAYHHMRAISLNPDRPGAHLNLGMALAELGQIDWAIRAFEVAAERSPEWPHPHRCLYQMYKRFKKDPQRAAGHMLRAINLRAKFRTTQTQHALNRNSWT